MRDHWVHAFAALTVGLSMLACGGGGGKSSSSSSSSSSTKKATPAAPVKTPDKKKDAKKDDKKKDDAKMVKKPEPKPLEGKEFNAFFPKDGAKGTKRVFKQEKEGFAQADYTDKKGVVMTVSISDTANNPSAREKFDKATDEFKGAPMMTRGKNSTLILAGGRFQIQLASKTLDEKGRKVWVEKVDVKGLAKLNK